MEVQIYITFLIYFHRTFCLMKKSVNTGIPSKSKLENRGRTCIVIIYETIEITEDGPFPTLSLKSQLPSSSFFLVSFSSLLSFVPKTPHLFDFLKVFGLWGFVGFVVQ